MLRIDGQRLYDSLDALGRIGAFLHENTGLQGVNRLALTDADAAGRRQVVAWMREAGLHVTIDGIGNVYGRREGTDPAAAPVMAGSHIDSVPTGGRFDGALGVLSGLEFVRTLNDRGLTTRRPVVVAFFTEEEGARFGTDMLGSAVATGRIPLEVARATRDADGIAVGDELDRILFTGEANPHLAPPHAYVELHIEQGPILGRKKLDIGVVTGVQAISWQELTIVGRAAHAGTTPMDLRADAGVAAARINLQIRNLAIDGQYGTDMRATMGAVRPYPGLVNIIPGQVIATVDLRNPHDAMMRAAEKALVAFALTVEAEEGVHIRFRQTARTDAVSFDASVQARIAATADALGLSHAPILSGAGHDAQEMSRLCKTAMIFVPGEHDGISHNPRELSTLKQCADGADVHANVLYALAEEP